MTSHGYYYVLGEGTRALSWGFPWPYGVGYDPRDLENPFVLWEGVAHGAVGGTFSAKYILEQDFCAHLVITDTEWLIPTLQRMAVGEPVGAEEILGGYRARHGMEPKRVDY